MQMAGVGLPLLDEIRGHRAHLQSEKVLHLTGEDDHRDPRCEACDDGIGNELDQRTHARQPEDHEDGAGDQRADDKSFVAVLCDDAVDDDHERAGGTTDLHAAAAEGRDEKAGDDRRVKPTLGRHSGSDGEGEGERKRDDADHHAGNHVARQRFAGIALPQTDD